MAERDRLVHMCTMGEWLEAKRSGSMRPESLAREGYVHLSEYWQVHIAANAHYAGRDDLVLLHIDRTRVGSKIRYEEADPPTRDGMRFPHLYGPLPASAVTGVEQMMCADGGGFASLI